MGQRDNVPARSVSCQPPKEGLDRTTTSGSKERDLLSNYRRRLSRVESTRTDTRQQRGRSMGESVDSYFDITLPQCWDGSTTHSISASNSCSTATTPLTPL